MIFRSCSDSIHIDAVDVSEMFRNTLETPYSGIEHVLATTGKSAFLSPAKEAKSTIATATNKNISYLNAVHILSFYKIIK